MGSEETLPPETADYANEHCNFLQTLLPGLLDLDEAAKSTHYCGGKIVLSQFLGAFKERQIVIGYVDCLVRHVHLHGCYKPLCIRIFIRIHAEFVKRFAASSYLYL